ncbi:MAG: AIR synthase related protein [Bacteroidota bacterium]|nr:AIR synthase related protein [Bacteroidota bacterium]
MDETDVIRLFLAELPPDPRRVSPFFASDAEILDGHAGPLLFTIDSFDAEDHFRTDDAYALGWNLAASTVSDISACGGSLEYYGHSATVSEEWDTTFISGLSRGIADVITACGGRFAGGDLGRARQWCYTGVALGRAERVVTRAGARAGDVLYITGCIGAGNFEAAMTLFHAAPAPSASRAPMTMASPRMRFPLRNREAVIVGRFASACIDTSDGLLRALQILAEINGTGFEIEDVPYFPDGQSLLRSLDLPVELLMGGECGEYELLCTVPRRDEEEFLSAVGDGRMRFHRIGTVTEHGTALMHSNGRILDLGDYGLRARRYSDHQVYVQDLARYFQSKRTFS